MCRESYSVNHSLLSIFSLEGHQEKTDERRGAGVYQRLISAMDRMQENRLIYGASVTVTRENLLEVASEGFVNDLRGRGCKENAPPSQQG